MKKVISVSMEPELIGVLDRMVEASRYESRSAAMEAAIRFFSEADIDAEYERTLAALTDEDRKDMRDFAELGMADYAELVGREPW